MTHEDADQPIGAVPDSLPGPTGVWPPPPTQQFDGPPGPIISLFRPTQSLAGWIVGLLVAGIACDSIGLFTSTLRTENGTALNALMMGLQAILMVTTGLLFFVWTFRSYKNLAVFGTVGLRMTPGWAVGYFFVPFLNLIRPYGAFKEMWQASTPPTPDAIDWAWTSVKTPPVLLAWWLLWLLKSVLDNIASRAFDDSAGTSIFITVSEIGHVVSIAAALGAIFVIRGITERQSARWQELTARRPVAVVLQAYSTSGPDGTTV